MKIFIIEHDEFCYDSYGGHVIVANKVKEVREIAKNKAADEGQEVWNTATVVICGEYTGDRKEPFILLSSFRAG